MGKIIFISDLHMGMGKSYEWLSDAESMAVGECLDYLSEQADVEQLVLLGDVADNNVWPIDRMPPSFGDILADITNKTVVQAVRKFHTNRKKVTYLRGNHDIDIQDADIQNAFGEQTEIVDDAVKFHDGKLHAEHGHKHFMWTSPDTRQENRYGILPVGYFLSRIAVTSFLKYNRKTKPLFKMLKDAVREALRANCISDAVLNFMMEQSGLDDHSTIIMRDGSRPTLAEIKQNYHGILDRWNVKRPNESFINQTLSMGSFKEELCQRHGVRTVIIGHTHERIVEKIVLNNRESENIYANSDCCTNDLCVFLETELDDNQRFRVQLKKWHRRKQEVRSTLPQKYKKIIRF
jgi:UDP-2,3-diacylglucosamine pyrophosphatase LpxH